MKEYMEKAYEYARETYYGIVKRAECIAYGILEKEISYTIALKVQPPAQNANYTIEKASKDTQYSPIKEEVDLIGSSDEFRICILENVPGFPYDKCKYYQAYGIMGKIDIYIPVKIEVSKRVEGKPEDFIPYEVSAIIELADPPEKRPKGRNGAKFIDSIIKKVPGGDNCPDIFAPNDFSDRCRSKGGIDKIQKIILDGNKKEFKLYNSNAVLVPIKEVDESKKGYAKIYLHFPPINGNNYSLKIKLINGCEEAVLKDKNNPNLQVPYVQTPTITIWKRVTIEMIALQEGIKYEDINWKLIKSTFSPAFIEVEEPPPGKRYTIMMKDWMDYLEKVVYSTWQTNAWKIYKNAKYTTIHQQDFGSYSFPQPHNNIPNSQLLTPPDNNPKNPNETTWMFLMNIAKEIFKDMLNKINKNYYNLISYPLKGYNIGFCVLLCKPPFLGSRVGGLYFGNKQFYFVSGWNMEKKFVHELGHALFLTHGATYLVRESDYKFITSREELGSKGPYWDDHDSEDMMSCVMSYFANVNWHFCGLCQLKLRLYDKEKMITGKDNILRKMLYSKKPKVYWVEDVLKQSQNGKIPWLKFHANSKFILNKGNVKELRLIPLYPPEIVNNVDYYKDLTGFTKGIKGSSPGRGSWLVEIEDHDSGQSRMGNVNVTKKGNFWISTIKINYRGKTTVKYRIYYDINKFVESDPLVIETIEEQMSKVDNFEL